MTMALKDCKNRKDVDAVFKAKGISLDNYEAKTRCSSMLWAIPRCSALSAILPMNKNTK